MMKTLKRKIALDRERYTVPRATQDIIPIDRIWKDGIFKSGEYYSKTYRIDDINYATASKEDKEAKFLSYSALLNALDIGATSKIKKCFIYCKMTLN